LKPHVLIARSDSEGDVLLAGPAVRAVAAGARRVTFLCGPRGEAAARLLPGVDEVIAWHLPWIDPEPAAVDRRDVLELVERLAVLGADQAFVLTSFHQSPLPLALLLRMAGVPAIAATSVDYPGSLLDVRHTVDDDVHEVERSLSLVAMLGHVPPAGDDGSLQVRRRDRSGRTVAEIAPRLAGRPFVAVHPGASVPARAWSPARHRELVAALTERGHAVAVTGGPGERALTAQVADAPHPDAVDLGGHTSLAELAQLLRAADVVVTGNTGPAHLAAAVGTPVVSLYAPTVPAVRWRPWRVPHVLVGHQEIACAGCRARSCPVPGHPCLDVSVEEVVDAVERFATSRLVEGGYEHHFAGAPA
jgi:ADP-heptose:LPS heptosyltransferase